MCYEVRNVLAVTVACTLAAGGCARTKMESTVSPYAAPRLYHHVLVVFPIQAEQREIVELAFAERSSAVTEFIPSHVVFDSLGEGSEAEINMRLAARDVDAVLRLMGAQSRTRSEYAGGVYLDKPQVDAELILLDYPSDSLIWSSTAETVGGALAGAGTLLRSLAEKTVEQLEEDGLVIAGVE